MPVYETDPGYLQEAIDSVRAQAYPDWELCIADDGSRRRQRPRGCSTPRRAADRADRGGPSRAQRRHLGGDQRGARARAAASTSPSSTTTTSCPPDALLAGRRGARPPIPSSTSSTRTPTSSTSHGAPRRPLPQARLVAHLRARARCTSATCSSCAASLVERGRRASTRPTTRSRTSSSCCASPSAPTGSTTSRRSSTTGARSPARSPPAPSRSQGVPELQARAVSAHLCADRRRGARRARIRSIPHRARAGARSPARTPGAVSSSSRRGDRGAGAAAIGSARDRAAPARRSSSPRRRRPPSGRSVVDSSPTTPAFSRARAANLGRRAALGERLLFSRDAAELAEAGLARAAAPAPGCPASPPPGRCSRVPTAAPRRPGVALGLDRAGDADARRARRRRRRLLRLALVLARRLGAERRLPAGRARAAFARGRRLRRGVRSPASRTSTSVSACVAAGHRLVYVGRPATVIVTSRRPPGGRRWTSSTGRSSSIAGIDAARARATPSSTPASTARRPRFGRRLRSVA